MALAIVFLFTVGWAWYYASIGWRWYLRALNKNPRRQFFTWRYRMTAVMIFVIVYFSALRTFGGKQPQLGMPVHAPRALADDVLKFDWQI